MIDGDCGGGAAVSGTATDVLWRDGDPWQDLTAAVLEAGSATVVTFNGTTALVDVSGGCYRRLPLEGGQLIFGDSVWWQLGTLVLSPCGVVVDAPRWYRSTTVRLVLAGLREDWPQTELGREVLRDVIGRKAPAAPGHPEDRCAAYHCPRAAT